MKLFRKYVSRSNMDGKRSISITVPGDIVILRSDKGVIEIFERDGKFFGKSMNLQPQMIDASADTIDECMRYFSFFPSESFDGAIASAAGDDDETFDKPAPYVVEKKKIGRPKKGE